MSHAYRAVSWTPQKKSYDRVLVGGIVLYLAVFLGASLAFQPTLTIETRLLRAFGSLALVMLTITLAVGPLARIDSRFLHVLYNRRHLGVATFLVAAAHGVFAMIQFHSLGPLNPVVSVLLGDGTFRTPTDIPFQPLGFAALGILLVMAATSHDFWLANLGPPFWKTIHMLVYAAYALVVGHVAFGALQAEASPALWGTLASFSIGLPLLHLWSLRGAGVPRSTSGDDWIDVGEAGGLTVGTGRVVELADGSRRALFRLDDRVVCVRNECCHQMGPLGEGRIVDGCITCPWHGFQYDPVTGVSPPPYDERIETYDVQLRGGRIHVRAAANPLGEHARYEEAP